MTRRRLASLAGSLALLLAPASARALSQPDGSPIPSNNNLKGYLDQQGESIDPGASAAVTPETFDPSCNLTFTVIARGGGQKNSFGWYNVTGQKPDPADLHEFLGCDDGVGVMKSLKIKSDPAYKGGKVGFFMASTEGKPGNCVKFGPGGPDPGTLGYMYYSERKYNDDNTASNGFIHLIILDSGAFPKAFYFGWEDLFGGGDNDFEDLLTRVQGIQCAGGGDACDTMKPGICAAGVTQCHDGKLQCSPQNQPGKESCNGLDDDCNGKVDDGMVCPVGQVCFHGACVGKCGAGEFQCPGGLECDEASGFCVDPACKGKQCPGGSVCRAGQCVAPCQGVTCPRGQVCRLDACVDPCAGVMCDDGSVCDGGVCREKCDCGGCQGGKACLPSGLCGDPECAQPKCAEGFYCAAGKCEDACDGAVCPSGQSCQKGKCVPGAGGAGGAGGSGGQTGGVIGGSGGSSGNQSASGAGGASGQGGASGKGGSSSKGGSKGLATVDATAEDDASSGGCGCRAAPEPSAPLALLGGAGLAALAAARRRKGR